MFQLETKIIANMYNLSGNSVGFDYAPRECGCK